MKPLTDYRCGESGGAEVLVNGARIPLLNGQVFSHDVTTQKGVEYWVSLDPRGLPPGAGVGVLLDGVDFTVGTATAGTPFSYAATVQGSQPQGMMMLGGPSLPPVQFGEPWPYDPIDVYVFTPISWLDPEVVCIHDINSRQQDAALIGPNIEGKITCMWTGPSDVGIDAISGLSALITGNFPADKKRYLTVSIKPAPPYLAVCGIAPVQTQLVRFCPNSEPEPSTGGWILDDGSPNHDDHVLCSAHSCCQCQCCHIHDCWRIDCCHVHYCLIEACRSLHADPESPAPEPLWVPDAWGDTGETAEQERWFPPAPYVLQIKHPARYLPFEFLGTASGSSTPPVGPPEPCCPCPAHGSAATGGGGAAAPVILARCHEYLQIFTQLHPPPPTQLHIGELAQVGFLYAAGIQPSSQIYDFRSTFSSLGSGTYTNIDFTAIGLELFPFPANAIPTPAPHENDFHNLFIQERDRCKNAPLRYPVQAGRGVAHNPVLVVNKVGLNHGSIRVGVQGPPGKFRLKNEIGPDGVVLCESGQSRTYSMAEWKQKCPRYFTPLSLECDEGGDGAVQIRYNYLYDGYQLRTEDKLEFTAWQLKAEPITPTNNPVVYNPCCIVQGTNALFSVTLEPRGKLHPA